MYGNSEYKDIMICFQFKVSFRAYGAANIQKGLDTVNVQEIEECLTGLAGKSLNELCIKTDPSTLIHYLLKNSQNPGIMVDRPRNTTVTTSSAPKTARKRKAEQEETVTGNAPASERETPARQLFKKRKGVASNSTPTKNALRQRKTRLSKTQLESLSDQDSGSDEDSPAIQPSRKSTQQLLSSKPIKTAAAQPHAETLKASATQSQRTPANKKGPQLNPTSSNTKNPGPQTPQAKKPSSNATKATKSKTKKALSKAKVSDTEEMEVDDGEKTEVTHEEGTELEEENTEVANEEEDEEEEKTEFTQEEYGETSDAEPRDEEEEFEDLKALRARHATMM